jgi:hypothetical protein
MRPDKQPALLSKSHAHGLKRLALVACGMALWVGHFSDFALATPSTPKPANSSTVQEVLLADLIKERYAIPKPELTALQIEEAYRQFEESLRGRRVRIEADVLDASYRPGGYFIHAQLPHMTRPVMFPAHKEAALAVRRGQKLVVVGTLRGLLGMSLEPQLDQLSFPDLPKPGGKLPATTAPTKK